MLLGSADKAKRLEAATALGCERHAGDQDAADRAAEGRDRSRRAGRDRRRPEGDRRPPGLGRAPRRGLHRRQPRLDPAAGRARPGHHLRPDGRHQHGARRADDDRRLRHLRDPEPVPGLPARRLRCLHAGGDPGLLPRRGAGRRRARARRHPLALRPAARDPARHLGHQPDAAAGGALDLRRAERAGREPGLAVGRRRRDEQPDAALQPHRDHRASRCWCWSACGP